MPTLMNLKAEGEEAQNGVECQGRKEEEEKKKEEKRRRKRRGKITVS